MKKSRLEVDAVGSEVLIDSGVDRDALFGLQLRAAVQRQNRGLLDALAVGRTQTRRAPKSAAGAQGIGSAGARHHPRSEKSVCFHATTGKKG